MNQHQFPIILSFMISTLTSLLAVASEDPTSSPTTGNTTEIVLASDVKWSPLNPARGDKSPQAGTLWGNRAGGEATGFLVKFVDGFASPPHIHNVTYRGVVISGLIHNDDPNAEEMWMPAGSYWTQPKGDVHITSAKGDHNVAYIEIEEGPYLVRPVDQAFGSGEVAINVDASNLVWLDAPGFSDSEMRPKIAYLWGDPHNNKLSGTMIKFPAGFSGKIDSAGSHLRAVVVQGQLELSTSETDESKNLEAGSYFSTKGELKLQTSQDSKAECIVYVRTKGTYNIVPAKP
jgi:quercetin dioxygenase-like cupin family protein